MRKHFDFIVVGAGSGGLAAVNRARKHGANGAIIEWQALGGTCVNLGCVPKKVMWNASSIAKTVSLAKDYGFELDVPPVDWAHLVRARQRYIQRLRDHYQQRLLTTDVTLISGKAQFRDDTTLQVGDKTYTADHILISTGSEAITPDIPGAELGITSDGFFSLTEQPKRVVIVGAGYIAVELAGVLAALGTETHLVFRHDTLLRQYDSMLGDTLLETMQKQGIILHPNSGVTRCEQQKKGVYNVHLKDNVILSEMDQIIWAIGRRPNITHLGLDNTRIATNSQGYIVVDKQQNTTLEKVYALGDVTGQAALTPVAIAAGRRLADRLFGQQKNACLDYKMIPTAIFSHPPIASVGLSECEAKKLHGDDQIKVYQSSFKAMVYALGEKATPTRIKVVTLLDEKIVGMHMIGDHADEILQGFAVALKMGATLEDFRNTVAIHPTSAEEIVTIDP